MFNNEHMSIIVHVYKWKIYVACGWMFKNILHMEAQDPKILWPLIYTGFYPGENFFQHIMVPTMHTK